MTAYKHLKRGSYYELLGEAECQLANPQVAGIPRPYSLVSEGDMIAVYRDATTGKLYWRFPPEFHDGRFAKVENEPWLNIGPFQTRAWTWAMSCFNERAVLDPMERNHRFLEESLELVQAAGCTQSEAHQLVDYVYGRPRGIIEQEVGGVVLTIALLCEIYGVSMVRSADAELQRCWQNIEKIRAKQAAKPKHSPLPE